MSLTRESRNELLYIAIEDNQNTIRFTDSKAGAVLVLSGILGAFLSTMGKDYLKYLKGLEESSAILFWVLLVILFIGAVMLVFSLYLSLLTIAPKSSPVHGVKYDLPDRPIDVFYLYDLKPKISLVNAFIDKGGYFKLEKQASSIKSSLDSLSDKTLNELLIYELQKVSYIREIKLQRVKRSVTYLIFSMLFFLILGIITVIHYLFF